MIWTQCNSLLVCGVSMVCVCTMKQAGNGILLADGNITMFGGIDSQVTVCLVFLSLRAHSSFSQTFPKREAFDFATHKKEADFNSICSQRASLVIIFVFLIANKSHKKGQKELWIDPQGLSAYLKPDIFSSRELHCKKSLKKCINAHGSMSLQYHEHTL